MSDSDQKSTQGAKPPQASSQPDSQAQDGLDVARRFLQDERVQNASIEEKTSFLKSKGISDNTIQKLLREDTTLETATEIKETPSSSESPQISPSATTPIITYPEFLTEAPRPPPLITQSNINTLLSSFVGLTTFLYGASHFLVQPMIDAQTDARHHLHATTSAKLDRMIAELEKTVSEIPPSTFRSRNSKAGGEHEGEEDGDGDEEDPSELFHRDVGTQTSPFLSTGTSLLSTTSTTAAVASQKSSHLSQQQSAHVTALNQKLASIKEDIRAQTEALEDTRSIIDVFRDDLDSMTYGATEYLGGVGGFDPFGTKAKNPPDDEIRNVRDAIRKVKGVLLSTRNFPSTAR